MQDSKAQVMSGVQTMQTECDRLQDEIDRISSEKNGLMKRIDENKETIAKLNEQVCLREGLLS